MSNIRLVKKNENHDNIRLGVNQSYYNEVVRRLQNTNVNETVDLINGGKYLDSKTLKKHKEKVKQYKSDFEYLNEIQKLTSNDYDESSYLETSKWLEDFTNVLNERESTFSKFKNELEYNDAVKIGELYDLPSTEIEQKMGVLVGETKAQIESLQSEYNRISKNLQQHNRGNTKYSSTEKLNAARKRKESLGKQISKLQKSIYGGGIAYTTSDGQNITWQSLYDDKKREEDLKALQAVTENEDFEEISQKGLSRKNPSPNMFETIEKRDGKWYTTGEFGKKKEIKNILTFVRDNAKST